MSSVSSVNSLLSSTSTSTTGNSGIDVSSILAAVAGTSTPGIDVNSAVAAALYADRAEERVWQSQQTTIQGQTAALTSIQTATNSLSSDFEALNSLTGPLAARTALSSNTTVVTASAAAGTVAGTHAVVVNSLAATGSWYSDSASSATATLPQSSFTLTTTAGASATINIGGNSGVNTLNDVADSINGQNLGVTARVVTDSSGSRLAIVSNTSGAAGDFSITSAPYTGTSWSSPSFSNGQTLGADSFTIEQNGTTSTINTTDGETLSQLAANVNSQVPGVTASVVNDSSGSHLSIVSTDGSTPFTISEPSFGFTQAAKGADASLTVDGVPVTSATNTVTGAISGVTLNLVGTSYSGSSTTISVGSDTSQISTAVNQFVTDYNSALKLVNSQFTYSTSTASQGALGSDPTVRSLQQTLLNVLNYVHAPATGITTVPTLASLGITAGSDGTLSLDSTTLDNAITNNPGDVQDFFLGSALNGFASTVQSQLDNFTNPGNGAFSVDLTSLSNTNNDLTQQINNFESIYIANQQTLLTALYSKAETALQQLPTQMAQIQAELGNNSKSGN